MGCCESKSSLNLDQIDIKLKKCIQSGNNSFLLQYSNILKHGNANLDINSVEIKVDTSLKVSPLGYSLILGQTEAFQLILSQLQGNFSSMEKNFSKYQTSGLVIICLNNYISLLPVYLPLFIDHERQELYYSSADSQVSGAFTKASMISIKSTTKSSFSAVQLACENGHISILNYFLNFHLDSLPKTVAEEVNLHFIDPETGFNCALIACKNNDLCMIKFLHIQVKANFFVINRFGENAVNVLAIGSQKHQGNTFKCLKYLVDDIGIDPLYNYQETLIVLNEPESVMYLEIKLDRFGLKPDRFKLIQECEVNPAKRAEVIQERTGNKFTFSSMFPELQASSTLSSLKGSQGNISRISPRNECQKTQKN